jgi:hypothetical protein
VLQASLFFKTNKYFHINKNDTGYHKALTHLRAQALLNHIANACSCLIVATAQRKQKYFFNRHLGSW